MWHKIAKFALAIAALGFGVGAEARIKADINISTPAGLNPGDTFRIVFVTDGTTTPTSDNIVDYNTFVTNDATTESGGGVHYGSTALTWSAIASTSTISAYTNTNSGTGASVWLANGPEVAATDTSAGLWSGTLMNPLDYDLTGNQLSVLVWTGSFANGTPVAGAELGTAAPEAGYSLNTGLPWMQDANPNPNLIFPRPNLYGISQELVVPQTASVPEPSTLVVAAFGAVCGLAYGWARHRLDQRRQRPVVVTPDATE
jgi:hypothetical protein